MNLHETLLKLGCSDMKKTPCGNFKFFITATGTWTTLCECGKLMDKIKEVKEPKKGWTRIEKYELCACGKQGKFIGSYGVYDE